MLFLVHLFLSFCFAFLFCDLASFLVLLPRGRNAHADHLEDLQKNETMRTSSGSAEHTKLRKGCTENSYNCSFTFWDRILIKFQAQNETEEWNLGGQRRTSNSFFKNVLQATSPQNISMNHKTSVYLPSCFVISILLYCTNVCDASRNLTVTAESAVSLNPCVDINSKKTFCPH